MLVLHPCHLISTANFSTFILGISWPLGGVDNDSNNNNNNNKNKNKNKNKNNNDNNNLT